MYYFIVKAAVKTDFKKSMNRIPFTKNAICEYFLTKQSSVYYNQLLCD